MVVEMGNEGGEDCVCRYIGVLVYTALVFRFCSWPWRCCSFNAIVSIYMPIGVERQY